jgi:hypothetical protein
MLWTKVKAGAAALCAIALICGAGAAAMRGGERPTAAGPAPVPPAPAAHALDSLKPGHWFEVPDSHLEKVGFKWPAGVKYSVNSIGLKGIMTCWSGGAYDPKRDRLIVWGGGHYAYAGNEVYAFDAKRLKWERLSDPSLQTDVEGKCERDGVYPDGLPRSCHTYDYVEYVPSLDRFCSFGVGATFPLTVGVDPKKLPTWAFNFETREWEKKGLIPWRVHSSALDPVTGQVWVRARMRPYIAQWNPLEDAWTIRSKGLPGGDCWAVSTVDPVGRKMYTIGHEYFWGYDIAAEGLITQEDVKSTGPQDLVRTKVGPAVDYDPVLDRFVCWAGGTDVFTLNLEKLEWKKVAAAAGNKATPTPPCKNGTFGRWRYVPSMNAYIVVNSVDTNVLFYRLSRREEQPVPERFVTALKSRDAAVVAWVAGQVALWPKARAEPVLKDGLKAQSGAAAEAIRKELAGLK